MYKFIMVLLYLFANKNSAGLKVPFNVEPKDVPELHNSTTRRIIRGQTVGTEISLYSYVARLRFQIKDDDLIYSICTASIVSQFWLLSAGHCLYKAGSTSTDKTTGDMDMAKSYTNVGYYFFDEKVPKVPLDYAIVYPDFNLSDYLVYDLMLIKTKQNLVEGGVTKIAILPQYHDVPPHGDPAIVLGWGTTSRANRYDTTTLQIGDQYIQTPQECYDYWINDEENVNKTPTFIPDAIICAEDRRSYIAVGDSGGPLVYNNKLVGVASWGDQPAAYTRVSYYVDWINETMTKGSSASPQTHTAPNITIDEAPYTAVLQLYSDRKLQKYTTCSGAVVTRHAILTAAQCFFKPNSSEVNFIVRDSYAMVGYDVWRESVTRHRLSYFRVHPDYNVSSHFANIGLIFTLTNLLVEDVIHPVRVGTLAEVNLGAQCVVPLYSNFVETNVTGTYVEDTKHLSFYLQRGFYSVFPITACGKYFKTYDEILMMCLKNNNSFPFHPNLGSPVIQNGVLVGIMSTPLTLDGKVNYAYSLANVMHLEITSWLEWVLWPAAGMSPLPGPCKDLHKVLIRDQKNHFKNLDHMWELGWVIPVCKEETNINFKWDDAGYIAKVTLVNDDGTYEVYSGVFINYRVVLTAAHYLFEPNTVKIKRRIQAIHVSKGTNRHETDATRFRSMYYRVHPDYDPENLVADIALHFLLWRSGPKSGVYAVVGEESEIVHGENVAFWGWGRTATDLERIGLDVEGDLHGNYSVLRKAEFNVNALDNCHDYSFRHEIINESNVICMTSVTHRVTFEGDTGGPFIVDNVALLGILSRPDTPRHDGFGIATRLPAFSHWIDSVVHNKSLITNNCSELLKLMDDEKDHELRTLDYMHQMKWKIPDCATNPFLTRARVFRKDLKDYVNCTGAVIRNEWAVSSASCPFGGNNPEVVVNASYLQVGEISLLRQYDIRLIKKHVNFSEESQLNDICLYKTYDYLSSSKSFARAIRLAEPAIDAVHKSVVAIGWKLVQRDKNPTALQVLKLSMTVTETSNCKINDTLEKNKVLCGQTPEGWVHENYGPVILEDTLLGLFSFGPGPVRITNVTAYENWILMIIKEGTEVAYIYKPEYT